MSAGEVNLTKKEIVEMHVFMLSSTQGMLTPWLLLLCCMQVTLT
jgi:hypothetical protein